MASEDANRSLNRLSSFSVYDDPPVTNAGLIKRQLDLELQLKHCIEQLIKAYLDTDSLDKVEELTEHQLSCCGRISFHRLQLLRLRRSQSLPEDQFDDVEDPVELPQNLLQLLADDFIMEESITSSDNTMETRPINHTVTDSQLNNVNDLLTDDAIDAELAEMIEAVVNRAIKNAVVQLVEQNMTASPNILLPSSVDLCHKEKEKDITKVKSTVKASDTNATVTVMCDEENGEKEKSIVEVVESESTDHDCTTKDEASKEITKGQVVCTEDDTVSHDTSPSFIKEIHTKCEEFPPEPPTSTQDVAKPITEEPVPMENTNMPVKHVKNDEATKDIEACTEDPVSTEVTRDSIKEPTTAPDDHNLPKNGSLPSTATAAIIESSNSSTDPIKESPIPIDSEKLVKSDDISSANLPAKVVQKGEPDSSKKALFHAQSSPVLDDPIHKGNLPSTATAAIIESSNSSTDPIKELPIPIDSEKLVKSDDISSANLPAKVVQKGEPDSSKKALFHAQSSPVLDDPIHKAKSKAQTLNSRTPPVTQKSKNLKTLGRAKPDISASADVTPLGAISTYEWDPTCLLEELYIDCKPVSPPGVQPSRLLVEMEKLPRNQLKKTIGKGWKKRYFCITSGNLYYYEDKKMAKALGVVKLNGAKVVCEDSVIKVTDKLNQTIAIRGKQEDAYRMHRALHLESVHPTLTSVITPYPSSDHPVVIVDIGSCSVRAGFARGEAYPRLFFPAVCSIVKDTDEIQSCGLDALIPSARKNSEIVFPTRQKLRMDQEASVPIRYIHFFLLYIFKELKVEPSSAKVILTLPQNYTEKDKELLMEVLLENLSCEAACLLEQSILSLYSYGATSGIVVDIGDRTDIVPIVDGYKIESGITKLKIGGAAVTESLRRLSTEQGLRYFSDVEFYITRLIKEKIGFVSQNFGDDLEHCGADVASYKRALEVAQYQLPDRKTLIAMDSPLFRSVEGFFQPSLWGKDIPSIPDSVLKAIQACDIDRRREMSRSIFLSGGATLATGFQERLEQELTAISPSSYTVQVQASVSRYHAAFLGAAILASLDSFQDSWITKEDFIRLKM